MKDSCEKQLTEFREKLSTQNRTKNLNLDDKLLLRFLRSRDGDVSESMSTLLAYIDIIDKRSDLFSWSEDIKKVVNSGVYVQYPERTSDGCVVSLVTPSKWNPSDYSYSIYIKLVIFMIEMSLLDEEVQKNGFIVVIDMSGIRWTHIYHTGVSDAKLFSDLTERILPRKLVSLHFVNANKLQDAGLMLFRPFMTSSTKKIMHFHGKDYSTLHSFVSPNLLPESLGGSAKDYPTSMYNQLLEKHKEEVMQIWDQFRKIKN
ncbi:alpha-tocopherol transfer protein-like [Panonychus citri]|uniref:alpha-tocopherol transfer protein-like n=1 Tax=Panonychus citri TaxID=50023 RepID=UPI002307EF9B|nr:alpha-tocopherol transfer protein-like [Panonychus citri]